MKKISTLLSFMLLVVFSAIGQTTVPKDTLNAVFSTFVDMNSKATDNSASASMRITSKASYFRYGMIGFDMKAKTSLREKAEIGLLVYQSTFDDYFLTGVGDFPLAVYAMKRKPTLPTNYTRFFNAPTDEPAGDGFVVTGTYPKTLSNNDGYKLGVINVKKTDVNNFLTLDVTDFVNQYINSNDSIFFFLTSDAPANGTVSLWIRSAAYGPVSSPKLYLYDEKPLTVIQGGKTMFKGEKDSVRIFFPPTATAPFNLTYTDGTTEYPVTGLTTGRYAFEVSPETDITYTLVSSSDASGAIAVDGSAEYKILTPNAVLSGINKIYAGTTAMLTVNFGGVAPFSFTYNDHNGTPITIGNILTNTYSFTVSPTSTHTYVLTNASDKNNSSIATSGSPLVTVIPSPQPVLSSGSEKWKIVVGDEFGRTSLDNTMWNVTVGNPRTENDLLVLPVEKSGASYVGSQIRMRDQLPNNTDIYIEARIKPLNAKGANTTFSTQTYSTQLASKYGNRYAMGFPYMTWRANNQFDVYYNLEDWKTNYYITEINPNKQVFMVRDSLKNHVVSDFKVFGVSISTNDIVYYVDGVEVKRASAMEGYNSGELVNALKSASTGSNLEDIAQKTYGYYGQNDWNYNAGYTGDLLALLVGSSFNAADVDASIEGQYATVDYVRIFKLTADIQKTPQHDLTFGVNVQPSVTGQASVQNKSIVLNTGGSASFTLPQEANLKTDAVRYFSTILRKSADAEFILNATDASGKILTGTVVDQYNQLQTGFGSNKLYYASTVSAEPTGRKVSYIRNDEATLLIGRLETRANGDDIMSIVLQPIMSDHTMPFYYPNIEGEYGHTSLNNKWDLSYKFEAGSDNISSIKLQSNRAESVVQKFLVGESFESVLPKESFAAFKPNLIYVNQGTQVNLEVELKGTAPWTLTYNDGTQSYTLYNITTSYLKIPVTPFKTTTYTLTQLTDGNGLEGIVSGKQLVKVKSDRAMTIYPAYDSYIDDNSPNNTYHTLQTGLLKRAGYAREVFFRYDISEFDNKDSIDLGSLSMFFISNDKGAPVILSLYAIEGGLPGDIEDLSWSNKPDDINYKFISDLTVPNPGFEGIMASWDVSSHVNNKLKAGVGMVDFAVRVTGGETTSLLTWRQYVLDYPQWENQFPRLELDPYAAPTSLEYVDGNNSRNVMLSVRPNPSINGFIRLNVQHAEEIEIFNLAGLLVGREPIIQGTVDVRSLNKGTYLLRVLTEKGYANGKLIIQ